jgi:DNA-binding XRE family transcriptional regulator
MLEHGKKPHIELKFIGPADNRDKAVKALKALGFTDISDFVPLDEALKELFPGKEEKDYSGIALKGARAKEGMTQKQLAKITGIPQSHISAMENGKTPVGKKRAKVFGKALHVDYRVFL